MDAELQASYDEFPYLSLAFPRRTPTGSQRSRGCTA